MTRLRYLLLALPMFATTAAAAAGSLSGDYLLTLTTTHPNAGTESYCLTLVDDGSVAGWRHSGTASIGDFIGGQFAVSGHDVVTTLGFHGVSFTFALPVRATRLGSATFMAMNQGEIAASGIATPGAKGSCTPF